MSEAQLNSRPLYLKWEISNFNGGKKFKRKNNQSPPRLGNLGGEIFPFLHRTKPNSYQAPNPIKIPGTFLNGANAPFLVKPLGKKESFPPMETLALIPLIFQPPEMFRGLNRLNFPAFNP